MYVQLTGIPAGNASEELIEGIIGTGRSVPLPWLQDRLGNALYHAELRRGAWLTDIGVWGPALFKTEAARILEGICPEFARLVPDGEAEAVTGT